MLAQNVNIILLCRSTASAATEENKHGILRRNEQLPRKDRRDDQLERTAENVSAERRKRNTRRKESAQWRQEIPQEWIQ